MVSILTKYSNGLYMFFTLRPEWPDRIYKMGWAHDAQKRFAIQKYTELIKSKQLIFFFSAKDNIFVYILICLALVIWC